MGHQQSIVKAKTDETDKMLLFAARNSDWWKERDMSVYVAVKVIESIEIWGTVYKEGEICLAVGGERHYQRPTEKDGLASLDFIETWFFIDNIIELDPTKRVGDLLDRYFQPIEDEAFYKKYETGEN